jgi:hypothetical protein
MKVRISFTIDIDADAWAAEYGIDPKDVRKDVQSYVGSEAWSWLRDRGLAN